MGERIGGQRVSGSFPLQPKVDVTPEQQLQQAEVQAEREVANAGADTRFDAPSPQRQYAKLFSNDQRDATALGTYPERAYALKDGKQQALYSAQSELATAEKALKPGERTDDSAETLRGRRDALLSAKPAESEITGAQKTVDDLSAKLKQAQGDAAGPQRTVSDFEAKFSTRGQWEKNVAGWQAELDRTSDPNRQRTLEGWITDAKLNHLPGPGAQRTCDAAQKTLASAQSSVRDLEAKLATATGTLEQKKATLADLGPKLETVERQLAFADAKQNVQQRGVELKAMDQVATKVSVREGQVIDESMRRMDKALDALDSAHEVASSKNVQAIATGLHRAGLVQKALDDGTVSPNDVNLQRLRYNTSKASAAMREVQGELETKTEAVIKQFEDKGFQAAFARMSRTDQQRIMNRFLEVAPHTKAGQDYFNAVMLPGLDGAAKHPLWNADALAQGNPQRAVDATTNILRQFKGALCSQPGGAEKAEEAVLASSGLKGPALETAKEAMSLYKESRLAMDPQAEEKLEKLLQKHDLGSALPYIKPAIALGRAVTAGGATLKLMKDPSVQQALEAGKSTAEVSEVVGEAMKKWGWSSSKYFELGGKAAAPMELAQGLLTLYGKDSPVEKGEVGETVATSMTTLGASMVSASLLLDAGLVTEPFAIGLKLAGGALAVGGKAVEWYCEPTEAQKFMQQFPEFDIKTAVDVPKPPPSVPRIIRG
jgi:hypothetical protein